MNPLNEKDRLTNEQIKKLFNEFEAYYEKSLEQNTRLLLQAYRQALDEIKGQMLRLIDKMDKPTITEAYKYNRLNQLYSNIEAEIRKLTQVSANIISGSIKKEFFRSYYETGFTLETSTGVNLGFTALNKDAIEYAISDNLWLDSLKNWNAELKSKIKYEFEQALRQNARKEVVSGLAQGKSYAQITKAIKERFDITAQRAKTITFTEMHKSYSKGRLEGINRAQEAGKALGVRVDKVWRYNYGAQKKPRRLHMVMDGALAVDDVFTLANGVTMEAPGLSGLAKEDINCHCSSQVQVEGFSGMSEDKKLKYLKSVDEWKKKRGIV